jgi:hypothetical protein
MFEFINKWNFHNYQINRLTNLIGRCLATLLINVLLDSDDSCNAFVIGVGTKIKI